MKEATNKIQIVIALGFLTNDDDCCLLVRRNEPGNSLITNRWEFPGGRVEFGEQPGHAAERELFEESGVTSFAYEMLPFTFVAVRNLDKLAINPIILCFRCRLVFLPEKPHRLPEKISEVRWVSISEIQNLRMQDGSYFFLQHILRNRKKYWLGNVRK